MDKKYVSKQIAEEGIVLLKNKNGAVLELLTLGATIKSLIVPDKNGDFRDVVIGHNKASEYEKHS